MRITVYYLCIISHVYFENGNFNLSLIKVTFNGICKERETSIVLLSLMTSHACTSSCGHHDVKKMLRLKRVREKQQK